MVDFPTAGLDCHVLFASREVASCGPREQGSYAAGFPTSVKTLYIRP
ncbi:MAG: hypothetical protein JF595_06265 [Sphingomonadales bacterium]|nr:hypothetical protein [Sphingomonadales bacterium]